MVLNEAKVKSENVLNLPFKALFVVVLYMIYS